MSDVKKLEKAVFDAIQTLLLSDHMGDAHEATLKLARAVGGSKLEESVSEYIDGDTDALNGDKRFSILGDDE